jgi:hypothetical protein
MVWSKMRRVIQPNIQVCSVDTSISRAGVVLAPVYIFQLQAGAELKDWDLWGPLILCLTLAILLSSQSSPATKLNPSLTAADDSGLVFGAVFIVTWCGAAVVTMNAKLLGGSVSFFQSICVLGYCLFPLVLSAIASTIIHAATSGKCLSLILM